MRTAASLGRVAGICIALFRMLLAVALTAPVAALAYSSGSGFFVTADGRFVTSHHVIDGAHRIALRLPDGRLLEATALRWDRASDVAILHVPGTYRAAPLGVTRDLRRGLEVLTVGFPLIDMQGLEPKVVMGLISSLSGPPGTKDLLTVSMPIQMGNSGGPLVTRDGVVIGIIQAKFDPRLTLRQGVVAEGIAFAARIEAIISMMMTSGGMPPLRSDPGQGRSMPTVELVAKVEQSIAMVLAFRSEQEARNAGLPPIRRESVAGLVSQPPAATFNASPRSESPSESTKPWERDWVSETDAHSAGRTRDETVRRMQEQAALSSARVDAGYGARVAAAIRSNTTYQAPGDLDGNPKAVFLVALRPDCSVSSVRLRRSSGVPAWDQAAERGIQRTDPFPRPVEGTCQGEVEIVRGPRDDR